MWVRYKRTVWGKTWEVLLLSEKNGKSRQKTVIRSTMGEVNTERWWANSVWSNFHCESMDIRSDAQHLRTRVK